MIRTRHLTGSIAIVAAAAASLGLVASVAPEAAATSSAPPQVVTSLNAICSTGDTGRPDPAWLRQSFEDDHCSAPQEPPIVDGTTANRDQLTAGLAAARAFAASSERYQQCISAYLTQRMQQAERTGRPVQATVITIETHRIVASSASKKRVWDRIAMAVDTFNAEGSGCPQ